MPDGCYEKAFIASAGEENLKNCYVTMGGLDASLLTGPGAEFVKKYKEKFGNDPEAYAVYGYEAAKVVLEAIKKVGKKDREAILQGDARRPRTSTRGRWASGASTRTATSASRIMTISKVEGGKFTPGQGSGQSEREGRTPYVRPSPPRPHPE